MLKSSLTTCIFISSRQSIKNAERDCDGTSDRPWAVPGVLAITVNPTGEATLDIGTLEMQGFVLFCFLPQTHIYRKGDPIRVPSFRSLLSGCLLRNLSPLIASQHILLLFITLSYLAKVPNLFLLLHFYCCFVFFSHLSTPLHTVFYNPQSLETTILSSACKFNLSSPMLKGEWMQSGFLHLACCT